MFTTEGNFCVYLDADSGMQDILQSARGSGYQSVYLAFRQYYSGPARFIIQNELERKAHLLEDYLDQV